MCGRGWRTCEGGKRERKTIASKTGWVIIRENIQIAFLLHERGDMQRKDRTCAESQYVCFVESLPAPSDVPFEMPDPILSLQNAVDAGDVCVLPECGDLNFLCVE